jgi:hypothetical protein
MKNVSILYTNMSEKSLLKNKVSQYLTMIKNNDLQSIPINNPNQLDLVPNYSYLIYNIEDEYYGRKVYTNVNISIGYYNPQPQDTSDDDSNKILLEDAIVLEYILRGTNNNLDPVNDINIQEFDIREEEITEVPIDTYTKIYKLPLEPLDIQRVPKIKEELEEMRWVPATNPNVPFLGEKFREAKASFEEKQKNYNGGSKLKNKLKNKSKKRIGKRRNKNKKTRKYKKSRKTR